jgi:YesN/AraC family two-component response regulator
MIKTLVVEDESKSRSMLLTMIQKVNPNLQIVGEANNVKDGVEKIKTLKPDLFSWM